MTSAMDTASSLRQEIDILKEENAGFTSEIKALTAKIEELEERVNHGEGSPSSGGAFGFLLDKPKVRKSWAAIAKFAMPDVPFEVTFAKFTKSQPRPAAPIPPPSFGPSGTLFDFYRLGLDEEAAASVASSSMKPPVARVKRRTSEDDDL
ncbi:hypothetical protein SeLEV6574_g05012 [Synchytrium endobioticum]|uniref:Uncharacterized protein n=1 Tax=Synchytrium endobioticum TaxID=286115 RepID=A0A507CWK2_9FUNG|nr:hypothetical protein SeLEV6574_g05012 [Synchytrium endobioticum]